MSNLSVKELEKLIASIKQNNTGMPDGSLRIGYSHGSVQYNHFKNGKLYYLKKSELDLAKKLAQKEYNQLLVKAARREIWHEKQQIKHQNLESVFEKLPKAKQVLVKPLVVSDKEFAENWQRQKFESRLEKPNGYLITDRGESVRSKTELIIANKLNAAGLKYFYEKPLYLYNYCYNPDFTILNVKSRTEIIWEHFGLMGDPKYRTNAWNKINHYLQCGYELGKNFIMTFEEEGSPVNVSTIDSIIKSILTEW